MNSKEGVNNMDLNKDNKVDFIKVVTKKKDESYTFTLQRDEHSMKYIFLVYAIF